MVDCRKLKGLATRVAINCSADKNWQIVDALKKVAENEKKTAAQVALNWVCVATWNHIDNLGATKISQLQDNLGALDFKLSAESRENSLRCVGSSPYSPICFLWYTDAINDQRWCQN